MSTSSETEENMSTSSETEENTMLPSAENTVSTNSETGGGIGNIMPKTETISEQYSKCNE